MKGVEALALPVNGAIVLAWQNSKSNRGAAGLKVRKVKKKKRARTGTAKEEREATDASRRIQSQT